MIALEAIRATEKKKERKCASRSTINISWATMVLIFFVDCFFPVIIYHYATVGVGSRGGQGREGGPYICDWEASTTLLCKEADSDKIFKLTVPL
jgi:hypothetical protein